MKEDIHSKLPRENGDIPPAEPYYSAQPVVEPKSQLAGSGRPWWTSGFFPLFWTVASALSILFNFVLCLVVLGLLSMRGTIQQAVTGQSSSVLGGLYSNFQAMDRATIKSNVTVDSTIPLNLMVPVQTRTTIILAEAATIRSPRVLIRTGGLTLDAPAMVTLPANQPLVVDLNFMLPVQTSVPVQLNVPVNIPLNQTELHGPFVGLQEVVRPWYCLFLPKTDVLYVQTCANTPLPFPTGSSTP
jgi:hypothetical protein